MIERQQASFLSAQEQRLLHAITLHLPGWFTPDRLTALGVLGAVLVLVGFVTSAWWIESLWLAIFGLIVNWFGDSLDGTVARARRIERPNYGFFLDQTIDVVSNLLIALGVGFSTWCRMDTALLMLTAYHMLSILTFVRSVVTRQFHVDVGGLGPTEMRIAIAAMAMGIMLFGAPKMMIWGVPVTWCDLLVGGTALALIGLFLVEFAREARAQLERDRTALRD